MRLLRSARKDRLFFLLKIILKNTYAQSTHLESAIGLTSSPSLRERTEVWVTTKYVIARKLRSSDDAIAEKIFYIKQLFKYKVGANCGRPKGAQSVCSNHRPLRSVPFMSTSGIALRSRVRMLRLIHFGHNFRNFMC